MKYLTESKCSCCKRLLTIDDINNYEDVCFSCCSKYHKSFEVAHSGECHINHKRLPISKNLKLYIFSRDKTCMSCKSSRDLTIDHIIPVSMGGSNDHSNLQLLCRMCNSNKSNYPADYREVIE